jgi:hypothetical protein
VEGNYIEHKTDEQAWITKEPAGTDEGQKQENAIMLEGKEEPETTDA